MTALAFGHIVLGFFALGVLIVAFVHGSGAWVIAVNSTSLGVNVMS